MKLIKQKKSLFYKEKLKENIGKPKEFGPLVFRLTL